MNSNRRFFIWLFGLLYFTCSTWLQAQSQYEEPVHIPKYNPNDPTHGHITPDNGKEHSDVPGDPDKKSGYAASDTNQGIIMFLLK